MSKKIYTTILLAAFSCMGLVAQEGRSLPFLEVNGDSRTAGMGDANMGKTNGMFIYNNPTAFLQHEGNIYGSYTMGLYSEINDSRKKYHAVSAGYKMYEKHALMVGFRYLGGAAIPRVNLDGVETKPIHPMDWSIDLAYALKLTNNFSAFISGNLIQSYVTKVAYTGGVSLGGYYTNTFDYATSLGEYTIGMDLRDLGGNIKYKDSDISAPMPTSLGFGGSIGLPINNTGVLTGALSTRYFMRPSNSSEFTTGFGLEYEYKKMLAIRTGYHIGDANNYFTMGLGCNWKMVQLNLAYSIASVKEFNKLTFGISTQF